MASPGASARLLMTADTAPPSMPCRSASISAARFEPRPEIRTVRRGIAVTGCLDSVDNRSGHPGCATNDRSDAVDCLACRGELRQRALRVVRCDHENHPDPAIEDAVHLGIGDVACALQPIEDRGALPCSAFDPR